MADAATVTVGAVMDTAAGLVMAESDVLDTAELVDPDMVAQDGLVMVASDLDTAGARRTASPAAVVRAAGSAADVQAADSPAAAMPVDSAAADT